MNIPIHTYMSTHMCTYFSYVYMQMCIYMINIKYFHLIWRIFSPSFFLSFFKISLALTLRAFVNYVNIYISQEEKAACTFPKGHLAILESAVNLSSWAVLASSYKSIIVDIWACSTTLYSELLIECLPLTLRAWHAFPFQISLEID